MPSSNKKSKRVFVFIDGENIRNAVQDLGFIDLDYEKLYDWFINKKGISRIYLYSAIEQGDTEKELYLSQLNKLQNFFVISKKVIPYKKTVLINTVCPACKHSFIRQVYSHRKKGNCDAELTLDIIRFGVRKKYDEIIVFTGDGDFASVLRYVSEDLKKKVFLYIPDGKRTSLKIKELKKSGIIACENISSILEHYGRKT